MGPYPIPSRLVLVEASSPGLLALIDWSTMMNMEEQILAALREQFNRWEELLASMSAGQITAPLLPSSWSTKDVIAM